MKINHGAAMIVELLVQQVWNTHYPIPGLLHNAISADHFEYIPYDAALYILAPYVLHDSEVDKDSTVHSLCEEIWEICGQDECTTEIEHELIEKLKKLKEHLDLNYEKAT